MSVPVIAHASPNFDARQRPVDLVVLHYTGMASLDSALKRLCDPAPLAGHYPGPWQASDIDPETALSRVSAHYVVARDGRVFQLVDEEQRAWHAGLSFWRGLEGVNHNAIGIEIENGGHDFGLPTFPAAQIEAVAGLVGDILARTGLPISAVVGHSDVAPTRKLDPGEHFPWARLAAAGAALEIPASPVLGGAVLAKQGDNGDAIATLQEALAGIGYGVPVNGDFCDLTGACVGAFQRRFRPALITGAVDEETVALLFGVLDMSLRLALPRRHSQG